MDNNAGMETSTPVRWHVWRQDDNGARFLVASCETEEDARASLEDVEATGGHHKQLYWMNRSDRSVR